MTEFLLQFAQNIGYFLILPIIIAWSISFLSSLLSQWLTIHTSYTITAILSFFGVVIHELSHLIVAIIFRHHITEFRLWQISDDGVLGYVNREYNPSSFYQKLGNIFISIAPIVGVTAAICSLIKFIWVPGLYIRNTFVILIIGSLLLGFNLSAADWQNFRRGIPLYLIVILFISTLQYLF
ncbi:MAG: hypothetical protein ACTH90_01760 [Leuconostoc mesenteroides]|jgi:hypothetical protein|uniref:hypothetical protein n=1 Tax=Leuconostoc mesenteroides TaxID=1245 RepID=UPI0002341565|nr:hypothetical protein [Leuconostoc mesenteroides]AET31159.1 hypothetical protein MI1_08585 [Leuconostoc mesenteroides subsp. mesenteroides J18]AQU50104.1 hypothetical protein ARA01_08875 [Leuconostoc mesenteroides subsp. mesenteroides]KAA8370088.1 hypothetical protein FE417_00650 [Leuconostoc mesenteroides]MBZ1508523.1 hypothetical protein [Leuconostoc mesenteroides]MBZ1512015.1 hypothetical protein [Leuconostoc mesenteroides]